MIANCGIGEAEIWALSIVGACCFLGTLAAFLQGDWPFGLLMALVWGAWAVGVALYCFGWPL